MSISAMKNSKHLSKNYDPTERKLRLDAFLTATRRSFNCDSTHFSLRRVAVFTPFARLYAEYRRAFTDSSVFFVLSVFCTNSPFLRTSIYAKFPAAPYL
jgi:hypothetical protein